MQQGRELWSWQAELATALDAIPPTHRLLAVLDKIGAPFPANISQDDHKSAAVDAPLSADELEQKSLDRTDTSQPPPPPKRKSRRRLIEADEAAVDPAFALGEIARAALSIVEALPVATLGELAEQRIELAADRALTRRLQIALPLITSLVLGGAVLGSWHFSGLIAQANKVESHAEAAIQANVHRTDEQAKQAAEAVARLHEQEATLAGIPTKIAVAQARAELRPPNGSKGRRSETEPLGVRLQILRSAALPLST